MSVVTDVSPEMLVVVGGTNTASLTHLHKKMSHLVRSVDLGDQENQVSVTFGSTPRLSLW